ncbi:MAG: CRTAC1 family protein [Planctomycetota bacterium]
MWRIERILLTSVLTLAASCGSSDEGDPDSRQEAPAPGHSFRGRLRQMPAWADDLRRRRDPVVDGWPTEAWATWIEKNLPDRVGRALAGDRGGLESLLADTFAGAGELCPAALRVVFDDGNTSVRRAGEIDRAIHPRAHLETLVAAWRATLAGTAPLRVDVDVDGLTSLGEDRFETAIRLRVSGRSGGGSVQQNARWRAEWIGGTGEPRLQRLEVLRYEEVRTRVRPFAELTRALLAPVAASREELLRGSDDYHLRQDRLSGQPYLGMHGLAFGDVDGDGLEDIYMPQPGGQPNRLLLHQPDGTLRDGTLAAGLEILDNCGPALLLDLDDDGDQDVAVASGSSILIGWNDGEGRFPEHTVLEGPDAPEVTSMSAADPDQDGDLDLYACRYARGGVGNGAPAPYWNAQNGERNLYWRNEGGRRFIEAAREVGLDVHATRFSLALLFEDLDDDGDVDLYVVNDFGKNAYYSNSGGKFTEVGEERGAAVPAAGMGVSAADVDRDGNLDLFLTNMDSPAGSRIASSPRFLPEQPDVAAAYQGHARGSTLLLGDGKGGFRDVTGDAGVGPSGWAWGGTFFDLQNDGWDDLYVPNGFATNRDADDLRSFFWRCVVGRTPREPPAPQPYVDAWDAIMHFSLFEGCSWNGRERNFAYLNLGGLRFAEAAAALEADFQDDGRLVAPTDWDDDGRVDLWLRNRTGPRLRFLRNVEPDPGHWIALDLRGSKKNLDAIGARAVVEAGGVESSRTVYAAQGFMAAPSRRLHFGLGALAKPVRIEVRWPDGTIETFADLAVDARYRIVQGEKTVQRVEPRRHPALEGLAHDPVRVPPTEVQRIVLYERLPAGPLVLPGIDGSKRGVETYRGQPLLVFLGMPGDAASEHLLQALESREAAFVALGTARVSVKDADQRFHRALEVFLVEILGPFDRVPYPLTMLFDSAGQLTAVYAGPAPVERILADVTLARDLDPATRSTELLLGGRWARPGARNLQVVGQVFDLLGDAEMARYYRGLAELQAGK